MDSKQKWITNDRISTQTGSSKRTLRKVKSHNKLGVRMGSHLLLHKLRVVHTKLDIYIFIPIHASHYVKKFEVWNSKNSQYIVATSNASVCFSNDNCFSQLW